MAQTFGMGRYVPPELEGTVSHNQASGKGHALGARAHKLKTEGIIIVRFECPFAIWCTNCQPEQIIAQGVRFNAEKKKVGNYYSSPIWSFRIKHTLCGKELEIRTDPQNAEYVVVEGGRRRGYGNTIGDSLLEDSFRMGSGMTGDEKELLEKEGGFAALEKKVEDKKEHDSQTKRLAELSRRSERDWADPYEMSRKLRRDFRVGRRQRQADEKSGDMLKDKYGIGFDLLAPTGEDNARSKLVRFGHVQQEHASSSKKGMFSSVASSVPETTKQGRATNPGDQHKPARTRNNASSTLQKASLQSSLQGNTRSIVDPFLREPQKWTPAGKRKRSDDVDEGNGKVRVENPLSLAKGSDATLVDYDSDSS